MSMPRNKKNRRRGRDTHRGPPYFAGNSFEGEAEQGESHPSHLRGKEIGLFYKHKHGQKVNQVTKKVPFAIPELYQQKIEMILKRLDPEWDVSTESSTSDDPAYRSTINPQMKKSSHFKYSYYDIISESFMEKLEQNIKDSPSILSTTESTDVMSKTLYEEYHTMIQKKKYQEMLKFREKLPTYKKGIEILSFIKKNQVVVISGETGCGKSTQVPQLILDDAILNMKGANTKVLVTQPRRIAASSLAKRVASERADNNLGLSVGYVVRLEQKPPRDFGSIMYCTTGILMYELETNQGLMGVSHVILDEVHERDANIDLTMCLLKQVLIKRSDLKVILMSATLDADRLSQYFNGCPYIHIEGLAYPVKDFYLEDVLEITGYEIRPQAKFENNQPKWAKHCQKREKLEKREKEMELKAQIGKWLHENSSKLSTKIFTMLQDPESEKLNLDLIVSLLKHICNDKPGAVLIFLPGLYDITKLIKIIEQSGCFPRERYHIYPLHSKLPTLEQYRIFESPPPGVRKIIVATNIAETSITIDDVVYVIDCGYNKMSGYIINDNIRTLQAEFISLANLRQRRGRAGRVQPGICYHLVTGYRKSQLEERPLPELQRSDLIEAVLAVKRLRLGLAADALMLVPDPPNLKTIQNAVTFLTSCGALDERECLTPLGWHLARLPVHPVAGKLLVLGSLFGCLDRAATLAAIWGFKDPFIVPLGKEKQVDAIKKTFAQDEPSDHVVMTEAVMAWENCPKQEAQDFAFRNFLSHNTLKLLQDMKRQFEANLRDMGFLNKGHIYGSWENRHANNISLFKAIVAASLYPNVGKVRWMGRDQKRRSIPYTAENGKVSYHPSSILADANYLKNVTRSEPKWLVYWTKMKSTKLFIFDGTMVHSLPLLFFSKSLQMEEDPGKPGHCLLEIDTYKVSCYKRTAELIIHLRRLLDKVLAQNVQAPSKTKAGRYFSKSDYEEDVLKAVIELITAEDLMLDGEDDYDCEYDTSASSSYY